MERMEIVVVSVRVVDNHVRAVVRADSPPSAVIHLRLTFPVIGPTDMIYLEETWILNENGGFVRKKNDSAGILILSAEISHIEFRE